MIVLIPSVPLVPVLYLSQALNAILLVPLLVVLNRLSGDRQLMGEHANSAVVTRPGLDGDARAARLRPRAGSRLPDVTT